MATRDGDPTSDDRFFDEEPPHFVSPEDFEREFGPLGDVPNEPSPIDVHEVSRVGREIRARSRRRDSSL
jgi:hypothetical protein